LGHIRVVKVCKPTNNFTVRLHFQQHNRSLTSPINQSHFTIPNGIMILYSSSSSSFIFRLKVHRNYNKTTQRTDRKYTDIYTKGHIDFFDVWIVILCTPVSGTRRDFLWRIPRDCGSALSKSLGKPSVTFKLLCSQCYICLVTKKLPVRSYAHAATHINDDEN